MAVTRLGHFPDSCDVKTCHNVDIRAFTLGILAESLICMVAATPQMRFEQVLSLHRQDVVPVYSLDLLLPAGVSTLQRDELKQSTRIYRQSVLQMSQL